MPLNGRLLSDLVVATASFDACASDLVSEAPEARERLDERLLASMVQQLDYRYVVVNNVCAVISSSEQKPTISQMVSDA